MSVYGTTASVIAGAGGAFTLTGMTTFDTQRPLFGPFNDGARAWVGISLWMTTTGLGLLAIDNETAPKYSNQTRNGLRLGGIMTLGLGTGLGGAGLMSRSQGALIGSMAAIVAGSVLTGIADDFAGIVNWPAE